MLIAVVNQMDGLRPGTTELNAIVTTIIVKRKRAK
jgi:hypothetical protein